MGGLHYDLSEEGGKYYRRNVDVQSGEKKAEGFCFGEAKVVSIPEFTEPADAFGHRISEVRYTYTVEGLPGWANREEVMNAFGNLKADVEAGSVPREELGVVVLTNNGWVHERLLGE